ncbi:MAG: dephospho-CoA kinase [Acidiferrobacteraceae bacterium]|nr:dephospho-CoA kinase [Acidiferrobacteraceae bacterium]|tara:strand:+ start:2101 stop:2703 length:603 start_codon:yes stop_codon:yes gene_type:complete
MLNIALTGGIGSGKSSATKYFRNLGITVLDADEFSHELTSKGTSTVQLLAKTFGDQVLALDGSLNRTVMRKLAFQNHSNRAKLESILHPKIRKKMKAAAKSVNSRYCVHAIPLLIETNQTKDFDRVLVIETPLSLRKERIAKRSNIQQSQIDQIIETQASDNERRSIADDLVVNDGTIEELYQKIDVLHHKYLMLANSGR